MSGLGLAGFGDPGGGGGGDGTRTPAQFVSGKGPPSSTPARSRIFLLFAANRSRVAASGVWKRPDVSGLLEGRAVIRNAVTGVDGRES
jgi:hypothetical protein